MAEQSYLENAPITEALIDLRVVRDGDIELAQLEAQYESFSDDYPVRKVLHSRHFDFSLDGDSDTANIQHNEFGYRYESEDGRQIVQFRLDGFTFSRLEPYETWEAMRDEAKRLWKIYASCTNPTSISRVATRYINRMKLMLPVRDFADYLTCPPMLPEQMPQSLSGFLSRIEAHYADDGASCLITQALENADQESITILLDIDVFVRDGFKVAEDGAWKKLERLREIKNEIFFQSITDRTVELFR